MRSGLSRFHCTLDFKTVADIHVGHSKHSTNCSCNHLSSAHELHVGSSQYTSSRSSCQKQHHGLPSLSIIIFIFFNSLEVSPYALAGTQTSAKSQATPQLVCVHVIDGNQIWCCRVSFLANYNNNCTYIPPNTFIPQSAPVLLHMVHTVVQYQTLFTQTKEKDALILLKEAQCSFQELASQLAVACSST